MTILITRPKTEAQELIKHFKEIGKNALILPLIEFKPGRELNYLQKALSKLQSKDLVFLISKQVVYFTKFHFKTKQITWPKYTEYYAIGKTTALTFQHENNLKVEYPKRSENTENLMKLKKLQQIYGKHALILRGNAGRAMLETKLKERGATVNFIECYQRCKITYNGAVEGERCKKQGIDTLIVTSGEMLHQLYSLFPNPYKKEWLLHCRIIVISKRLANLAKILGWKDILVTERPDNNSILKTLYKND